MDSTKSLEMEIARLNASLERLEPVIRRLASAIENKKDNMSPTMKKAIEMMRE